MAENLTGEEAAKLTELIAEVSVAAAKAEMLPATLNVEASIRRHVFNDGTTPNGVQIGQYSTRPFYLHLDSAAKRFGGALPLGGIKPVGKPKKGKKRGAKARLLSGQVVPIQSHYFAGGYAEFRQTVGRQVERVDLMLSGRLAESIQTGLRESECVIAFTREESAQIAEGNEIHFQGKKDTIFAGNSDDAKGVLEALTEAGSRAVDQLFRK